MFGNQQNLYHCALKEQTSGIHGGYRLVSTYDLPDLAASGGGGGGGGEGGKTENTQSVKKWLNLGGGVERGEGVGCQN